MRVIIRKDYEAVSEFVAQYIRKRINEFKPTAERPFVLGLPTGSTPIGTYKRLVQYVKEGSLSFRYVVTFNMDEYVALPRDHPESYWSFMHKHLFDHIDIQPENVHILNGNAADPVAECAHYEQMIKDAGGIDLFLGGIGPDGHIAFNEPGSSLASRTGVRDLTDDTVIANSRFFDGDLSKVPRRALSVGVGTITDAREVLIIATGHNKARAVAHCIEEGVNHMWTCSVLQLHPNATIALDDAATDELRVKTVKYFGALQACYDREMQPASGDPATKSQ